MGVGLVLALLIIGALPVALGHATPVGPVGSARAPSGASAGATGHSTVSSTSAAPHPASFSGTATFYDNRTVPTNFVMPDIPCLVYNYSPFFEYFCYNSSFNPTILTLGNGDLGVSYEVMTNTLSGYCPGAAAGYTTAVGWQRSTTDGDTWGAPTYFDNMTCAYVNAIEPSFAVAGHSVYGVFVEENDTQGTPGDFVDRTTSALGFVKSTNDGASFAAPVTLPSGTFVAHPQIAVFGSTIYVTFEMVQNSSTAVAAGGPYCSYCTYTPVAIEYMVSTNGGTSWSSPAILPGENASSLYFSLGQSIAVNATGTVAVAYFTNQTCLWIDPYSLGCNDWGLDLVVVTTPDNFTTLSGPTTITRGVGETYEATFSYHNDYPATWAPTTSILFDATGSSIYVAWDGAYDHASDKTNPDYEWSGAFFAAGSATGPWTVSTIQTVNASQNFDSMGIPALGLSGGTLYYTYMWENGSYCPSFGCDFLIGSQSERVRTSVDGGVSWSDPVVMQAGQFSNYCDPWCGGDSYLGTQSSIAFTTNGTPVIAYPMAHQETYTFTYWGGNYYDNFTTGASLQVAFPARTSNVAITVTETGLTVPDWSFIIQGTTITVSGSASYTVTNVPTGITIIIEPVVFATGYGEIVIADSSVGPAATFTTSATVVLSYITEYLFQMGISPSVSQATVEFFYNGTYYEVYTGAYCYLTGSPPVPYCYSYYDAYPPQPWYFPNNTVLASTYTDGIFYWNGTGSGSFTGNGYAVNITINGVTNETAWAGGFGVYNETFLANGLPSTSTFHYTFNGTSYSAPSTAISIAPGIVSGAYTVSNVWASSSTSGWEYFGTPDVGSVVIVPAEPIVNFTFALVNVGGSTGTISFHAVGLTPGTVWHFGFNGTEYASSTPWINVTEHAGTFPVQGYPVTASTGTVGYTPTGLASTLSVTPGGSYDVDFTNAYQVNALAGTGGSISGTGHGTLWLAAGANATFHAVAAPNYLFGGWTGTGTGSYTGSSTYANITIGGPITETASFYPVAANRFNLTFLESGLPAGTWWTVYVGGLGYSSDTNRIVVGSLFPCGSSGTYTLSVPTAYANGTSLSRYAPGSYPATVCTNGATILTITFQPQFLLTLEATPGGVAQATAGSGSSTVRLWVANATSVELTAVHLTGYGFLGWNGTGPGSYTGTQADTSLTMIAPIVELAAFAATVPTPTPTYWLNLSTNSVLAPGTAWTVSLAGTGYATTSRWLNISGLVAATYPLTVGTVNAPDGLSRYAPLNPPASVTIPSTGALVLSFSTSYWVSITAAPGGRVTLPATTQGWYFSGSPITLDAAANPGLVFLGWSGTGAGAYSGTENRSTLHVNGPITEVASFGSAPPAATVSSSGSIWSSSALWIGLAALGLVLGTILGLVAARRRGPRAPPPSPPPTAAEAPPPAVPDYIEEAP